MNIGDYFVALAKANPDYAAAANEISTAQDFADEVVRRRIALAWTQDDLAHSARTTQPVVSRVENGVANLTVATMDKFRRALLEGELALTPTSPVGVFGGNSSWDHIVGFTNFGVYFSDSSTAFGVSEPTTTYVVATTSVERATSLSSRLSLGVADKVAA